MNAGIFVFRPEGQPHINPGQRPRMGSNVDTRALKVAKHLRGLCRPWLNSVRLRGPRAIHRLICPAPRGRIPSLSSIESKKAWINTIPHLDAVIFFI